MCANSPVYLYPKDKGKDRKSKFDGSGEKVKGMAVVVAAEKLIIVIPQQSIIVYT